MSATVFISHSSADRSAAAEICAELEQRGVGCWIALRDISPGANFGEAITSAMSMARIMVLVFSRNADRSDEIKKEVVLAGQHGLVVIPLRIEDVLPSGALQYELSTRQWVDMFADRTAGLERLVRQVEQVVATPKAAEGLVALPVLPAAAERVSIPVEAGSPEFAQAAAPAPAEKPDQHNLPHEATAFIGRETELLEIDGFLQQRRRVTLVGSGGVGKTRLALRVGVGAIDRFRDGVWLVELAPLAEASLVAEAVCRVISAPVSGARPAVDVAVSFLRQKNLLLVLDNCEHLLGGAAELTSALIAHCPGVSILATSREPLKIPGEVVYKVSTLPVPGIGQGDTAQDALRFASVRLLVQRAADSGGFYRFSDADAPSVSKICRRLDGVAMAIELAAARMTVLKVKEIALRLENAFRLLNSGGKSSLPRHQTLWATIDWSHSLLSPDEQMLLRRLSVYVDGFSLDGATAAAQGDGLDADDVLDLLDPLVDKSLVTADMSGVITRYRMLEATRHYAREKLKASGETGRDRLASAYLAAFCRRAEATWPTTPTEAWLAEFAPEVENLRSAIDWAFGRSEKYHAVAGESGDPVLGVELVAYACSIAEEMSLQADMKRWTATALQHLTPATPPDQAGWVFLLSTRWDWEFAAPAISLPRQKAITLFREGGCPRGLSKALRMGAMAISRPGDMPPEVRTMLAEAVEVLKPCGRTKDLAMALFQMGSYFYFIGDFATARTYYEEAQAMRRGLGDRSGLIVSALNLAELEFLSGKREKAIAVARAAVSDAREAGNMAVLANLLANMAGYLLASEQAAEAHTAASEALSINRALGLHGFAIFCLEHLALAHALSGAHEQAARVLGYTEGYIRRNEQGRDLLEQAGYDRLMGSLREALSDEACASLMAEGQAWPDDLADLMAQKNPAETMVTVAA